MTAEQDSILKSNSRVDQQSKETGHAESGASNAWRRLKRRLHLGAHAGDTPGNDPTVSPISSIGKEAVLDGRHIITDVLPHSLDDKNPIEYDDIETVMEWAQHPDVAGHIYRLESGPEELYQGDRRKWLYLEYYRGVRDDEGKSAEPKNSTFFKAVNSAGQMLAVATMRWKDVEFVKRGRTAYWERLIVNPSLQGKKIGLAFGIDMLDTAFYRYDGYDGRPATEVRGSIYEDRTAKRFDRNKLFFLMFGFKQEGHIINLEDGRAIQSWKLSLENYELNRPKAVENIANEQPERKEYLEAVWPVLR